MQITKIFHFNFFKKFFLHLQMLVLIIAHQDEIINANDKKNLTSPTCATYMLKSTSLLKFLMFFKKNLASGSKLSEIISSCIKTCETYTQDVHLLVQSLGLFHVDLLFKVTIKKCCFDVHLMNLHFFNGR
jgi:hypothetical protein